jgi:predicted O-methyltransferase YrrM
MKTDPFSIKKYPKWHPQRLAFTLQARSIELEAKSNFDKYALPELIVPDLPPSPNLDYANTAVTSSQMQHLLAALAATEHLKDTVVVELGAYRGITTQVLANNTSRQVVAIDPYIGYGGSEEDYQIFKGNTQGLQNLIHERKPSGEAARDWQHGSIGFIFIDALHDYVNTAFDIQTWSPLITKGGILACHDTDEKPFPGTRKAAYEFSHSAQLFAHPENLTIFNIK